MLRFGYMGLQGDIGRRLSSSHSLLPSALSTPHPNKQNTYITVVFFFFLHPLKTFAAIFQTHHYLTLTIQRTPHKDVFLNHIQRDPGQLSSEVSQEDTRKKQKFGDTNINSKYSIEVNTLILKRKSLNVFLIMSHEYDTIL